MDTGNTAWVLVSAALVLIMTPGLALFYGGMVRSRHVLAMMMQSFVVIGVVSVLWVALGYTLAFGPDINGLIGGLHFAGLEHMDEVVPGYVKGASDLTQSIPPIVFSGFQMMFAIITPALLTGAIADRARFGPFVALVAAWSLLVYAPVAHWVFSPSGWLFKLGALDFAGGTVVHINAGVAGLVLAVFLGKRRGWPHAPMRPHSLPLTLLGAALLWMGWFGFNAGSALGANAVAGYALMNSQVAAAAALLAWLAVERIRGGHATTLGAASGAIAGLVAVTPAAGFVSPLGAVALGLVAGGVCALAVSLKFKLGFDDSLDVVAVHLVGGIIGSVAVGLLASTSVNPAGLDGLLYGGGLGLLGHQLVAVLSVLAYSALITLALAWLINLVVPLRATPEAEDAGLDASLHAESAYDFGLVHSSTAASAAALVHPDPAPTAPAQRTEAAPATLSGTQQ